VTSPSVESFNIEKRRSALLCPSAPPEWPGAHLIGVAIGSAMQPNVVYTGPQPVTETLLGLAGPVTPTELFRFAAPCKERACVQYDGSRCRLSRAIADLPPGNGGNTSPVRASLPSCGIRSRCRWWREEGADACRRCPEIVTDNPAVRSDLRRRVVDASRQSAQQSPGAIGEYVR
jgi:hypothetical protein